MKKFASRLAMACLLLAAVLGLAFANPGAALAQDTQSSEYPFVASLEPFSPEANYMSLPGYLRYLVYARDGIWLSRGEAVAIVDSQEAAAGL